MGHVGRLTKGDRQRMTVGEHQHNLLQAICRASVRNGTGGACGACTAYVIGKIDSDSRAALAQTFPGAQIKDWRPLEATLRGHAKALADVLEQMFADEQVTAVPKATVRKAVGLRHSRELARVMGRDDVQRWIADRGLTTTTREVLRQAA